MNKRIICLLVIAFLSTLLGRVTVCADVENCDGFVFTDSRSGKKACILSGWKKETRNSYSTTSDYFYYGDSDYFVAIDSHPFYDDLTEEDKKIYSSEDFAKFTMSDDDVSKHALSMATNFANELGVDAEGSMIKIGNINWIKLDVDYSKQGYALKSTMYARIIDGYFIAVSFDKSHTESEELARSIATDFSSQVIYPNNNEPTISPQGEIIKQNRAISDAFLSAIKYFLAGSLFLAVIRFIKKNKNQKTESNEIAATNTENNDAISAVTEEFKKQEINRKNNADKNKVAYDENRGLEREKPIYFAGARNAEQYLNSLTDEEGNKLHFGMRYSYSVDDIPEMLDCYKMLKENGEYYGDLYVSIYGQDNYKYVPKGYRHPKLSKPIEKKKIELTTKQEETEKTDPTIMSTLASTSSSTSGTAKPVISNSPPILFCRKCGTKLDEGATFCRKCGTKNSWEQDLEPDDKYSS